MEHYIITGVDSNPIIEKVIVFRFWNKIDSPTSLNLVPFPQWSNIYAIILIALHRVNVISFDILIQLPEKKRISTIKIIHCFPPMI